MTDDSALWVCAVCRKACSEEDEKEEEEDERASDFWVGGSLVMPFL